MVRYFGWCWGAVLAIGLLLSSGAASAQSATPPDVVVLKDGSRYRGTIAELLKNGPVTIVLITGETRKLKAADITYAGPSANEPGASAPSSNAAADAWPPVVSAEAPVVPATPAPAAEAAAPAPTAPIAEPERVKIRFFSNRDNAEVFARRPGKRFRKLCLAPCARELAPAVYNIGVRFNPEGEIQGLRTVVLDQPVTVEVDYRSRNGLRGAGGLVVGIAALTAALSFFYLAVAKHPTDELAYVGIGTGVVGSVVGIALLSVDDGVALTVK